MKKVLIFIISMLIALPVFGEFVDIYNVTNVDVPTDEAGSEIIVPTEQDLINDDGDREYLWSGPSGFGTTFNIDFDCWLMMIKIYAYSYGVTHDVMLDCFGWDDANSTPEETDSYFGGRIEFPGSGPYDNEWAEFDVSDEHVFFEDGDTITLFSEGGTSPWYCPEDGNGSAPQYSGWLWFGGSTWIDYSSYGYGAIMIRGVVNDDVDPPYVDQQNPPDGGDGYPDTDIVFHTIDDDIGVDTSTIDFSAEDESKSMAGNKLASAFVIKTSKGVVPGSLDIDDTDPNDVICTFTPDSDLPIGDTITCTVATGLADLLTNATDTDIQWSFEVIPYEGIESKSLGSIKTEFE
jgi:hypothetical protein